MQAIRFGVANVQGLRAEAFVDPRIRKPDELGGIMADYIRRELNNSAMEVALLNAPDTVSLTMERTQSATSPQEDTFTLRVVGLEPSTNKIKAWRNIEIRHSDVRRNAYNLPSLLIRGLEDFQNAWADARVEQTHGVVRFLDRTKPF